MGPAAARPPPVECRAGAVPARPGRAEADRPPAAAAPSVSARHGCRGAGRIAPDRPHLRAAAGVHAGLRPGRFHPDCRRPPMTEILVLYYSAGGSVRDMARLIARGITQEDKPPKPNKNTPKNKHTNQEQSTGHTHGSPTRFGNMAAPLKYFLDTT